MRCLLIFLVFHLVFSGKAQPYNYYFGNLHAHTGFSDGNKDSLSSGISRPDGSYAYAKLSNDFDFLGISEHNHYSNNNNPGFEIQNYAIGLNMANTANQDGVFSCLFGIEYGVSSDYNGHVIVYGFNQLIGWEPGNYDIYNDKSDYDGLFRKVKNNPNAFCYLAHPYHTDFSTNGTFSGALAYMPYNSAYDSAIVGVPLRSGLAFSQADTYDDYATGDYISYYRRLLFKGYHLGMGYDHDNHYTNFGRSNGGRLVILAPALSRQNIVEAMQKMRFYGSDDANAKIDFNMNGQVMGSIVQGTVYPSFQLTHADPDGETADTLKLFRGSANTGTLWAEQVQMTTGNNTLQFTDYAIQMNKEYYYYAEIKQQDQQLIVTSPIWYTGLAPLSLDEHSAELKLLLYPNPSKGQVHLNVNCESSYKVRLTDTLGKEVYSTTCTKTPQVLELDQVGKGIYILEVTTPNGSTRRQLKLE
ncbi:MAG: T9SS type A sorting domain-containing protein [Bacteroidia bacterium]|jgi:hypothetical protein|nr:T9SS type A sorting domain-containing protein [Bacteroidia bacterium]